MTDIENPAGKVAGYTAQPDAKVALVNEFKAMEERLYRAIEKAESDGRYSYQTEGLPNSDYRDGNGSHFYRRDPLVEEATRCFMIGFMLLNRAVFQPQRIALPEDDTGYKMTAYGRREDGSIGPMKEPE